MKKSAVYHLMSRSNVPALLAGAALLLALYSVPSRVRAQDEKSAGAFVSEKASAKEVGLPLYPGSKPHVDKDKSDDSPSANMGLWLGGAGFQLVVVKMESTDSPEKVASYYRKELAKYGTVLDCSNPAAAQPDKSSSNALTCGDDKPDGGGMLFKAGSKEKQHIVGVQAEGSGTVYQLVYLIAKSGHKAAL